MNSQYVTGIDFRTDSVWVFVVNVLAGRIVLTAISYYETKHSSNTC